MKNPLKRSTGHWHNLFVRLWVDSKVSKRIILYAEDDLDDFESAKEIVDQLSDRHLLVNAKNGAEAVAYLEQHSSRLPCMVILDLNMPVMNGKEVRSIQARSTAP